MRVAVQPAVSSDSCLLRRPASVCFLQNLIAKQSPALQFPAFLVGRQNLATGDLAEVLSKPSRR